MSACMEGFLNIFFVTIFPSLLFIVDIPEEESGDVVPVLI